MNPSKKNDLHLTLQELLKLSFSWEEAPLKSNFDIVRSDSKITISRDEVINQIIRELPGFDSYTRADFNSTSAWSRVRQIASAMLRGEPPPITQPNQIQMAEFEKKHQARIKRLQDELKISKPEAILLLKKDLLELTPSNISNLYPDLSPVEIGMVMKIAEDQDLPLKDAVSQISNIFDKEIERSPDTRDADPKTPAPEPVHENAVDRDRDIRLQTETPETESHVESNSAPDSKTSIFEASEIKNDANVTNDLPVGQKKGSQIENNPPFEDVDTNSADEIEKYVSKDRSEKLPPSESISNTDSNLPISRSTIPSESVLPTQKASSLISPEKSETGTVSNLDRKLETASNEEGGQTTKISNEIEKLTERAEARDTNLTDVLKDPSIIVRKIGGEVSTGISSGETGNEQVIEDTNSQIQSPELPIPETKYEKSLPQEPLSNAENESGILLAPSHPEKAIPETVEGQPLPETVMQTQGEKEISISDNNADIMPEEQFKTEQQPSTSTKTQVDTPKVENLSESASAVQNEGSLAASNTNLKTLENAPEGNLDKTLYEPQKWESEMQIVEDLAQDLALKRGDTSPKGIKEARKEIWATMVASQPDSTINLNSAPSTRGYGLGTKPQVTSSGKTKDVSEGSEQKGIHEGLSGKRTRPRKSSLVKELDVIALRELRDVGAYLKSVWNYKLMEQALADEQALQLDIEFFPDDIEPNYNLPLGEEFTYDREKISSDNMLAQLAKGEIQSRVMSKVSGKALGSLAGAAGRTAATAAAQTAATGASVAAAGSTTAIAAAAGVAAPPIGLALLAAKAISKIKGIFTGFLKIFSPSLLSKAKIGARKGVDGLFSGGIFGNSLMILGALAGFAVGGPIGALVLGGAGKFIPSLIGGTLGTLGAVIPGSGDKKKKGLLIVLGSSSAAVGGLAWVGVVLLVVLGFFIFNQFFTLPGALRAAPEATENYGPEPFFEIEKTASCKVGGVTRDCSALPNNESYQIQYTIIIKSLTNNPALPAELQGKDINFTVTDVLNGLSEDGELELPQLAVPSTLSLSPGQEATLGPSQIPEISFSGPEFNDSVINNSVTAIGTVVGASESQTKTSIATVVIGKPNDPPPYEFPFAGTLVDIDDQEIEAPDGVRKHRGWFEPLGRVVDGGTDIPGGGQDVVSTVDGIVVYADVHTGNPVASNNYAKCVNYNFTGGAECMYKFGVGGAVYIRSKVGQYMAAYLHLDTPTVTPGQEVTRGQVIGRIYPGNLPTTTGPHIHYQVLKNGLNLGFADPANAGRCLDGKIESVVHQVGDTVPVAKEGDCN